MRETLLRSAAPLALAGLAVGPPVAAASSVDVSPDISVELGAPTVHHEDVAEDTGAAFLLHALGALPMNADVVGYEEVSGGVLLAFDTTVALAPGGVTAEPRDVVRWDGATYSLEFDGSAEGVPPGAGVDAIGWGAASELLLSFDTTVDLPGASGVSDEEVVSFDGASFTVLFDGTALGAAAGPLDTDALQRRPGGELRLSFDGSGQLGGIDFDDEDALDYDAGGGTWSLAYDGSARDPDWAAADLVAIPEPAVGLGLAAGLFWLAAASRRREGVRQRCSTHRCEEVCE